MSKAEISQQPAENNVSQPELLQSQAADSKASAMKATERGRQSSARRKVVISDDPNQKSKASMRQSQKTEQPLADTQGTVVIDAKAQSKNLLSKRKSKPAYLQSLNESEKQANFKIIDSMNKKISYLKNPRHKINKAPILMTTAIQEGGEASELQKQSSFRVEPAAVNFVEYQVNGVYEISVKVTNQAKVSKRIKFIPPITEMFTVRKVKYPSGATGDVAPGMSLTFAVTFQAPSFADFDDSITFITEENSFKLPLKARREPPVISLVNPMNCLNSWLGDRVDMAFRCVNQGGDGGFKFFCDKDEDDLKQTDVDSIRIGSFTLNPSEFYLQSGQAIDIYVTFQPECEGQLEEKLILACDNQTSEYYKVTGTGAVLDLDIVSVDDKEVDFKANPFETMYFENTNPTSKSVRTIKIRNGAPIGVPFHWSVYRQKNSNKISLADEETHYSIVPAQGKIDGGETMEFQVFFSPLHAEPYFEFADLIVEDIPISSVRCPPEGLKNFAAANQIKSKVPMPTYVGSNTQFLSIPMIMFNLRGQGNSCKVCVDPPVTFFEGDTYIDTSYSQKLKLMKVTEGMVKYNLRMESKNRDTFDVKVRVAGKVLSDECPIVEGEINEDVELQIDIKSSQCGKAIAYFYIEIEDGPPVSFSCQADFRGPIVKLVEPVLDLGLAKVNTQQEFTFSIENQSPIDATFMIKNSKNKRLNFTNFVTVEKAEQAALEGQQIEQALVIGKPIKTRRGNMMNFDIVHYTLRPKQRVSIKLSADCINQESIEEYFEILVQNSDSLFFQVLGEVQVPRVYLNRETVELGKIYAGIRETIDGDTGKHKSQALELVNYGNLPVKFKWEEVEDYKRAVARFEPTRGTIPPKGKVKISFDLTVFMGGQIDELFMCDIQDLELPLGFEVKADAFGLNVAYLTSEEQQLASTCSLFDGAKDDFGSLNEEQVYGSMNKLQMITFANCSINKRSTQKFYLKNLSGIKTKFNFGSINFEPISHVAPQQKTEIQLALEQEQKRIKEEQEAAAAERDAMGSRKRGSRKITFAASVKSNTGAFDKRRTQPILSDEHEQTQKFTSVTGNTFTATKALEKDQAYYLSNNKGIATVFTPHEGELPPNAEVPITVTLYNNVVGKFDDRIVANVEGLPAVQFPIRINISGSPIMIPNNQVGLNYNTIPPTLPIPTVVANSTSMTKSFKIKNTGIRALQVDWKIFDQKDLQKADNDQFDVKIIKNQSFDKKRNPYKFNFIAIEPEETKDSAFEINPKNFTCPARSIQEFQVTFNPTKDVGNFKSIVIASPELAQEEIEIAGDSSELPKKGALGIIALNMNANTIAPQLSLDKSVKMDGGKHINFKKWAVVDDDAPNIIQKLTFSNDTKADMIFNFQTSGPFEIVKSKSNTGAKHPLSTEGKQSKLIKQKVETMFCLQPLKIVELQVKFLAPKATELDEWSMIMKNERKGELLASFQNGDTQKFALNGQLLRPKIILLTEYMSKNDKAQDEIEFPICNVDRTRRIKIFLSNITEVSANWSLGYVKFPKKQTISKYTTTQWEEENLEKVDDPDVFEFQLTQGTLKGKSLPLRKMPEGLFTPPVPMDEYEKQYMPQTILVDFKPKKNVLYKSKFRFMVENGLSCDVILKGKGSYEENHD